MKKIIHLSDVHSGYGGLTARLGDLVTRMIFHKTPADHYIVVITGDIVDDATRDGSYEEASVHLNRLEKAGFTVLTVPGNHDYGTGNIGDAKYVKRFKKHFFGSARVRYPKLDLIDDIALIGLDSMEDEVNWDDFLWAQGELGTRQLKRLARLLASDDVAHAGYRVVYLHHHPFHPKPFHQLRDSRELGEILTGHAVDALLFGHNHDGRVWNGHWGISRVYDGGTSTGKEGSPAPHRVIDLNREPSCDYDAQF